METILIVDDDTDITEGLATALNLTGRNVVTCHEIEAAQILVENQEFDAIVSDVRLTGPFAFEGLDFVNHVRRHAPHTKIILMTGVSSSDLTAEASRRGAAACLSKPFDLVSLETLLDGAHAGS